MPIRSLPLIALVLALSPAAHAATTPKPAFSAMDVFALEWASDPEISPDGSQVAYVRRSFDIRSDSRRSAIWIVGKDGANHRPLSGATGNESSPRWSPDGSRIAFVAADADGSAQIHVHWLSQGVTSRVTNLTDAPSRLAWSPDGRQLAFVMRVPAKREPLKVKLPEPPKGAKWADPVQAIDRVVYRADGEGFLPDAFRQVFVVPADGSARQLTGALAARRLSWTPTAGAAGVRQPPRRCGPVAGDRDPCDRPATGRSAR
jgi:dipeptidyl aminopeptidase/acylaminoacyl peptidase